MANGNRPTDMKLTDTRPTDTGLTDKAIERDLAPFFAAARQAEPPPRPEFLSAILADAGEVAAARAALPAMPDGPQPAMRPGLMQRFCAGFAPLGGCRGAMALAGCAAAGFWLGASVSESVDTSGLWSNPAGIESMGDPVADFFDLASAAG